MSEKNICVCDFSECKLYLENPIALSCGSTICKEHIENLDHKFKCSICDEEHSIPENGYQINKTLSKIINSGLHLNKTHKNTIESFKKLDSIMNQYDSIDSETMIYDYFSNIRNKVDLHREKLIEEINERSNEIINQLNRLEKECKSNAAKLNKMSLEKLKNIEISLWKSQLRMPSINLNKINNLNDEINTIIKDIQNDMENYKNDLLMDRSIEFIPSNNNLFGQLKIKCNEIKLTDDFGSCVRTFGEHCGLIRSFQVDEISKKLITGSTDNKIKIWNLETGECLKTLDDHKGWVTCILLYTDNKFISCSDDKTIKIWSLDSFECLNTLTNDLGVFSMCFLSDNMLASGCYEGKINVWNLDNFNLVHSFDAHKEIVSVLKLTEDSKLVSCSSDAKIKLWNIETYECILTLSGHNDYIYCLELTPNGKLLSGSEDKSIKLWDLETGECLKKIDLNAEIYSLKLLSKDILVIGSSLKDNIAIFNMKNLEIVKTIDLHNDLVFCLNILENGHLMSASRDKTIKLWKI